jgi:L-alanine-DL-glutamate epimerase-like enolase superfamily enzyme
MLLPSVQGRTTLAVMKIVRIELFTIGAGDTGARGAAQGESQYWGGGWQARTLIANPMSIYPEYAEIRSLWMGPGQDPYAIEIEADDGTVGSCVNYGGGAFACAVIDQHFKRFLIGSDPFDIERIWDQMNRSTLPYGLGGVTSMAMAGVDLALYDLVARSLDLPVYKLLGGRTKERIPCYATIHPDHAEHWKDRGFFGVKIAAPWGVESGREGIAKMEALLRKLRADLGDGMDIMVDCYLSWDVEFATRLAARIQDLDIKWFEDPLQNGWATGQNRHLREKLGPIQLATGNLEYHEKAFHDIIVNGATDIIQPEIQWVGGLTPTRRIAAVAKHYDMQVIPHGASVYNYHFVISNTNSAYAEFLSTGDGTELKPIFDTIIGEPLPVDGCIELDPDKPGFGVELNREKLVKWTG